MKFFAESVIILLSAISYQSALRSLLGLRSFHDLRSLGGVDGDVDGEVDGVVELSIISLQLVLQCKSIVSS